MAAHTLGRVLEFRRYLGYESGVTGNFKGVHADFLSIHAVSGAVELTGPIESGEHKRQVQNTMMRRYSCVLFDLDGTLIDSLEGIVSSLKRAIEFFGLPVPDDRTMRSFVGPPLIESFTNILGLCRKDAEKAVEVYRENFDIGVACNPLFPGICEMLDSLREAKMPIAVATSKPKLLAVRILDNHQITPYFCAIEGGKPNEEDGEKAIVVGNALGALNNMCVDTSRAVMVGDRCYDSHGARANGLPAILVSWGYASKEELAKEKFVVDDVEQLTSALLSPL